jgi:hypothetical protein
MGEAGIVQDIATRKDFVCLAEMAVREDLPKPSADEGFVRF